MKDKIKQAIEKIEYYQNGFNMYASGEDVRVINLRITKKKAICDVILTEDYGETEKRYNKCEYDLKSLRIKN